MAINGTSNGMINQINRSQQMMNLYAKQVSSGNRLVHAGVDPAGSAISSKMQAQIRGLNQASRNVQDGLSMLQVADAGLKNINDMIGQIKELTTQAANDTNSADERKAIQGQINEIISEIESSVTNTQFNGKKLIDGSVSNLWIQSGANAGQGSSVNITGISSTMLTNLKDAFSTSDGLDFTTASAADISAMINDSSLTAVGNAASASQAGVGATMNRLEHTQKAIDVTSTALQEANSRIADTDEAKAMMQYNQEALKQQASILMLGNMMQQQGMLLNLLI